MTGVLIPTAAYHVKDVHVFTIPPSDASVILLVISTGTVVSIMISGVEFPRIHVREDVVYKHPQGAIAMPLV